MKVIRGSKNLKKIKGAVLTMGVFDGVHVGHARIIGEVVRLARKLKVKSVVVTFDPHPLKVLKHKYAVPSLISLNHRMRLIEECGVDILVIIIFTKSFSRLSPEKFIKNILVDKIGAGHIFIGEDFYFGKGGAGNIPALKAFGERYGFKVNVVKPVKIGGVVSSSRIRRLITSGALVEAAGLLGRPVSILGTVVPGSKLGRFLGYPTANINPHHEVIPPSGVYAVKVRFNKNEYDGVLNIGLRPTFYSSRDKEPAVEVHIFGFKANLYNKDLEVLFVKKLRDEFKFKTKEALIAQIKEDAQAARAVLS